MTNAAERSRDAVQDAAEDAADSLWLERLARAGLAGRGVLYLVVALLAVRVAFGEKVEKADKQGALRAVVEQPLGRVLLLVLAVGFAGYALWRFVEAIVGPSDEDDARKAAFKRVGYAGRGVLYTALFVSAVGLVRSSARAGEANDAEADVTARVLEWPAGPWLVGAVGLAVVAGGLYVGWRGVSCQFRERLKSFEMGRGERRIVVRLGVVGMVTRMVVLVIIGILLVVAAAQHDAQEAVGIDGALKRLAGRPFGTLLLVVAALGLAAYGLYSLAESRYRRIGSDGSR